MLTAILCNTVLLMIENPANTLTKEQVLLMVSADMVLTVRTARALASCPEL